jgi:hypothetical protein
VKGLVPPAGDKAVGTRKSIFDENPAIINKLKAELHVSEGLRKLDRQHPEIRVLFASMIEAKPAPSVMLIAVLPVNLTSAELPFSVEPKTIGVSFSVIVLTGLDCGIQIWPVDRRNRDLCRSWRCSGKGCGARDDGVIESTHNPSP